MTSTVSAMTSLQFGSLRRRAAHSPAGFGAISSPVVVASPVRPIAGVDHRHRAAAVGSVAVVPIIGPPSKIPTDGGPNPNLFTNA
jgi:hypothetical protein